MTFPTCASLGLRWCLMTSRRDTGPTLNRKLCFFDGSLNSRPSSSGFAAFFRSAIAANLMPLIRHRTGRPRTVPSVIERTDELAVLRLSNPPANALDLEFMQVTIVELDEVEASDARALIVTGENNVFSAGADLFRVLEEGSEY